MKSNVCMAKIIFLCLKTMGKQKIDQIGKSSFNGECFNKPNVYGEGWVGSLKYFNGPNRYGKGGK